MLSSAALSDAELRSIREGILLNFREDGRTLLQQRPVHIYMEHMREEMSDQATESGHVIDKLHHHKEDNINSNYLFVHKANASSDAHNIIAEESYNGSKLRLESDGTVILVRAVPSVIEVCTFDNVTSNNNSSNSNTGNEEDGKRKASSTNTNKEKQEEEEESLEEKRAKEVKSNGIVDEEELEEEEEEEKGNGELYIHIDAVSQVVDYYSNLLGGKASRYRRSYLALLANLIHATFGANGVNCSVSSAGQSSQQQQQQLMAGIAAAERVNEDEDELLEQNTQIEEEEEEEEEEEYDEDDDEDNMHYPQTSATSKDGTKRIRLTRKYKNKNQQPSMSSSHNVKSVNECNEMHRNGLPCQTGFPARELYIGSGYAFRIDVHLHILQGLGGNITSLLALAIHVALKTLQLPHVTLQTSAAGITVEVDQSRLYTRPIHWDELPLLISLPLAPSHHYLIDPSAHEESALPQQCVIAANARGQVCAMQFIQLPSRQRESVISHEELEQSKQQYHDNEMQIHSSQPNTTLLEPSSSTSSSLIKADQSNITHSMKQSGHSVSKQSDETGFNSYEFNLSDCAALLHDGIQICQSMILDCNKVLAMETENHDKL